jgi:LacI family transcriptional regulator
MITIRELAREVGLSPTTVSMVLNSSPVVRKIPEETKERVRAAAKEFGYSPNPFARILRSNRSAYVGILLSDISDPYCTEVLMGIDNSLYHSGYIPILLDIRNSRIKFRRYVQTLIDRRIEGIIGVANLLLLQSELLAIIKERKIPIVLIGRETEESGINSVFVDNETGGYLAIKHLYELGHRSIAFIKGPKGMVDSKRRWQGIVSFAREAGLSIDVNLTMQLEVARSSYEAGFETTLKLLNSRRRFTALLAFDDLTAFGAIRAFAQVGKIVPKDCSVIGFDDIAAATFYNPPITTIRQPMEKLGALAVETFLDLANAFFAQKEIKLAHRKIKPKLIIRASTSRLG